VGANVVPSTPQSLFMRLRTIIRTIRISPLKMELLRSCSENNQPTQRGSGKTIKLDTPTRWNSTFLMVSSALDMQGAISKVLSHHEFRSDFTEFLTPGDWNALECIRGLLSPFKDLTEDISGSTYPTLSYAVARSRSCETFLQPQAIGNFKLGESFS
jgi:hypothetical protein